MTAPFLADPAFKASVLGKIKLGRLGQVEDLMERSSTSPLTHHLS